MARALLGADLPADHGVLQPLQPAGQSGGRQGRQGPRRHATGGRTARGKHTSTHAHTSTSYIILYLADAFIQSESYLQGLGALLLGTLAMGGGVGRG